MGSYSDEIEDNLYKLLQEISSKMYDPVRARYEYASIPERFKMLLTMKQQDDKDLTTYTKRFKQASDNFTAVMGEGVLDNYVKRTDEYVNATSMNKQAHSKWVTFIYMDNIDKSKYGTLMNNLRSQYSLGNNQYPTMLGAGNDVQYVTYEGPGTVCAGLIKDTVAQYTHKAKVLK